MGLPIIGLNDGAGARIQEGVAGLNAYGGIFHRNARASGVVPQISVILGPCAGRRRLLSGPDGLHLHGEGHQPHVHHRSRRRQDRDRRGRHLEELGGAQTHATKSGVAHFVLPDEKSVLDEVRYLLSFFPSNNMEEAPRIMTGDDPDRLCEDLRDCCRSRPTSPTT
jgi:acetyl-CoA carboxylase carboxyltransferase component